MNGSLMTQKTWCGGTGHVATNPTKTTSDYDLLSWPEVGKNYNLDCSHDYTLNTRCPENPPEAQ